MAGVTLFVDWRDVYFVAVEKLRKKGYGDKINTLPSHSLAVNSSVN